MTHSHSSLTLVSCPRCGSQKLTFSSKQFTNGSVKAFFYKIYRCENCSHRFKVVLHSRFLTIVAMGISFVLILTSAINLSEQTNEIYAEERAQPEIFDLAQQGDAEAELKLGLLNKHSNPKEASEWLEKSASHGNLNAKFYYGMALMEGNGVLQNFKEAIRWLEEAAMLGHTGAQYEMGNILDEGKGVPRDTQKAYMWFTLAAAKNESNAHIRRDSIAKTLTLDQILAMQEEAKKVVSKDLHLNEQKL